MVLNAYWLVSDFIVFSGNITFDILITMLEVVVAIFYTLFDYKKPHGNLMRYLLILHVFLSAITFVDSAVTQPKYVNVMFLIILTLVSYMAGRLDHYKQNVVICGIVLVCNAVISYYLLNMFIGFGFEMNLANIGCCLGCVTVWLAIAGGYIIRYQLHKEAGLEEKK